MLFSFGVNERQAYQALMEKADPSKANSTSPYIAKQQHNNVRKDIRTLKKGVPVQFQLFSQDTELILDHHDARTDVIEKMSKVACYMQEEKYYLLPDNKEVYRQPNGLLANGNGVFLSEAEEKTLRPVQVIQYLEADTASYYYQAEQLSAKKVKISRFLALGHDLGDSIEKLQPLMEGTADAIEFSLAKNETKFAATELTAILHDPKGDLESHPMVIDSKQAQYDGNQITLNGNVTLRHDTGTITAQKVIISSQDAQRKMALSKIHMSGGVRLAANGGGELICSRAEIDSALHLGTFYSDDNEPVIYREFTAQNKSLTVKSDHMTVEMDSVVKENNSHKGLKNVAANGHVNVNFNDFIATSDHGTYQTGIIALSASPHGQGLCEVSNRNGDRIVAHEIKMDTLRRNVECHNPDGQLLYAAQAKEKPSQVHFSCKTLNWDEEKQRLTLFEDVKIEQEGLGVVTTDDQIAFVRQYIEGVPQLCLAESTGNTVFVYTDSEKQEKHTLKCQGKATIDHPHKEIRIDSPQDSIVNHKQIFFQDSLGDIHADKMLIRYAMNDQKFNVSSVLLEGHVHLHNNGSIEPGKTKAFLEYALADVVEYNPNTKEVQLSAINKRRVLFFDKVNNLQISAPKLKIKRDAALQKDSIQGIGDVRFNFVKNELEEMKKFMAI